MPQSPRRNSQTQTNWADQLSANRYAAGAVVALLAAYVVTGREAPRTSRPNRGHVTRTGPSPTARRTTSTPVWKSNLRRVPRPRHRREMT